MTTSFAKKAGLLDLVGPAASAALMEGQHMHEEQQAQEAALLNQLFRELEERRQAGNVSGLKGTAQMLSPQGNAAERLNEMSSYWHTMGLAKQSHVFAKTALGVPGAGLVKGVAKALTPGWKGKALIAAGGLGTAYAGAKALSATKDYMQAPTQLATERGGMGRLKSQVNEFGY